MTWTVESYLQLVRLGGLAVGPGDRLVIGETAPGRDGTTFETALHGHDPLVPAAPGNAAVGFTRDGDLLFLAKRDDLAAPKEEEVGAAPSLWLLPMTAGEARRVASAPAGFGATAVARDADVIVTLIEVFPDAESLEADRALATARKDAGASGFLWDSYPVRHWDRALAPRRPRLFVTDTAGSPLRDLTGDVGDALVEQAPVLTADGTTVLTGWAVPTGHGDTHHELVEIDVATGRRTTVATVDGWDIAAPAISPDGRWVAYIRERTTRPDLSARLEAWLLDRTTGTSRRLAPELDRWPEALAVTADAVLVTSADNGTGAIWRIPLLPDAPAELLSGAGAFTEVTPSWEGEAVFAVRSTVDNAPELVRIAPDGEVAVLRARKPSEPYPGRLAEVTTTAVDGTPLRGWLVLPAAATEPAPLVVFIHGGPLSSWNGWQWRWQPALLAARGYAVLLPDPAFSTGYGQAMVDRGWGQWGGTPYDDVLALTDAALSRPDLDEDRTAVMGGSYGGYLTNWTITHTDRFHCAITHASLWDLVAFRGVTDHGEYWEGEFGHPRRDAAFYRQWSPATYADALVTPTLVIHGEQDFRVPVGEGLALYTELQRSGVPSQLLYFPDENHWVLNPGNVVTWYQTVLAWLDHWLLGAELVRPPHV